MNRPDSAMAFDSITGLAARIQAGEQSPTALAQQSIERIDSLDARLHSFLMVTRERALAEARTAEGARGPGPLSGIPYAAKDLFDVAGCPTTAGTRVLANNIAAADCTVVRKLAEAGMVLLGKTHTVQLAYGTLGINHDQGTPHNPWHRVPHAPGGSSSGSAVAVAAGLAPMALGTDTGGSVRIPAGFCGIVGLKTTVGRISRAGIYPLSWTLDSVGPLTRSVEDAALVYQALQGPDPRDPATIGVTPHDALSGLKRGVKGLRLAFGETIFFDDADIEVEKAVRGAGAVLRSLGAAVESMEIPEVAAIWGEKHRSLFVAAEACFSNRELLDNHRDELDPIVATRMIPGRSLAATDYFHLERRFSDLREQVLRRLRDVDALLLPTTPIAAPPIAEADASLEAYGKINLKLHRNSGVGNYLNVCAVSVPCGFTSKGLPIGLMIVAKPFQEDVALRIAYAYEQATEWHTRRPDLTWAAATAAAT